MPVHLFAGGIEEDLGGDGHDLVLLKQGLFLIHIDHAKFHLVAVAGLKSAMTLFHLLAGDAVLGAEFIEGRLAWLAAAAPWAGAGTDCQDHKIDTSKIKPCESTIP